MATTSVEIYLTLGDDTVIANQICVLVTTQSNSTPLDPTSFREEDMIEHFIGLGWEQLEGMLQLLDIEMVLAFSSGSNIMAAMCHFAVAMNWQACQAPYLAPDDHAGKGLHFHME